MSRLLFSTIFIILVQLASAQSLNIENILQKTKRFNKELHPLSGTPISLLYPKHFKLDRNFN